MSREGRGGDPGRSELGEVARELEADLRHLERAAAEMQGQRLDSARNLQRGAQALERIAELEQRLGLRLATLVRAVNAAAERQTAAATAVARFGEALRERQVLYVALATRFDEMGREAGEISNLLAGGIENIAAASDMLAALEQKAEDLAQDALDGGFQDLVAAARKRQRELNTLRTTLGHALAQLTEH